MLNQFTIVGRIDGVEIVEERVVLNVKVQRPFKNADGVYEHDLITVQAINSSNRITEYLSVGDVVGIKGRIQDNNVLFAEKTSFISSNKKE